jgi:hypothetical protein
MGGGKKMIGIGMWELLLIGICGFVVIGVPVIVVILALVLGGRGRGPDDAR